MELIGNVSWAELTSEVVGDFACRRIGACVSPVHVVQITPKVAQV